MQQSTLQPPTSIVLLIFLLFASNAAGTLFLEEGAKSGRRQLLSHTYDYCGTTSPCGVCDGAVLNADKCNVSFVSKHSMRVTATRCARPSAGAPCRSMTCSLLMQLRRPLNLLCMCNLHTPPLAASVIPACCSLADTRQLGKGQHHLSLARGPAGRRRSQQHVQPTRSGVGPLSHTH